MFLLAADIGEKAYDRALVDVRFGSNCEKLDVILHSDGGDPSVGFQFGELFRAHCGQFRAIVPHHAKSAATMICLAALEIEISWEGHLGPIDMQVIDRRDRERWMSALEGFKALEALTLFSTNYLLDSYNAIDVLTRNRWRKGEILDRAISMTVPAVRPLFERVDPQDVQRYTRALQVQEEYGKRLIRRARPDLPAAQVQEIVTRLVFGYPDHAFVIDRQEAAEIGLPAVAPDATTEFLAKAIAYAIPPDGFVGFRDGGTVVAKFLPQPHEQKEAPTDGKAEAPAEASS